MGKNKIYIPQYAPIQLLLKPFRIVANHHYVIKSTRPHSSVGHCQPNHAWLAPYNACVEGYGDYFTFTDNHFFVGGTSLAQCQLTNITNYRFPSGTIYNAVALVSGLGKDLKSKLYVDYGEAGYRTITVLDYGIYTDLFLETESIVAPNDSNLISTPPVEDAIAPTAATTDVQQPKPQ